MPGPEWCDDEDTPALIANATTLGVDVVDSALARDSPTATLICEWHARLFEGTDVPSDQYRGNFRGSTLHPDLIDYHNHVQGIQGSRPELVFGEVDALIGVWLAKELARLDKLEELAGPTPSESAELALQEAVLGVAARLHGEWIRIHPFANGNGRTARIWVIWLLARFGMPSPILIRPRLGAEYGSTCKASMTSGQHHEFEVFLRQLYFA